MAEEINAVCDKETGGLAGEKFYKKKEVIMEKEIRCPRLGDEMALSYCLKESGDLPCSLIVRCWSPYCDINAFLKEILTSEQWDKFTNFQSNDKVTSLIELIELAKTKNE